ncbi:MAG TPA: energy transducer TonB [Terriglobales bacterium]|nr:energy transducer TonB [Terriglobales bacterium]
MLNLKGQSEFTPDQKEYAGDHTVAEPRFLPQIEPWASAFFSNLTDRLLFRTAPQVETTAEPAPFWPDVFVQPRVPWWTLAQSAVYHAGLVAALVLVSHIWVQQPRITPRNIFDHTQVTYYNASEYLPPLNTAGELPKRIQKGEPEHAKQPIISVPPEADNREQTIVTPPQVKIAENVPLPNLVAWTPTPAAVPATGVAENRKLTLPLEAPSVIAPPPETKAVAGSRPSLPPPNVVPPPADATALTNLRTANGNQPAVVEPPPALDAVHRPVGDLNIAHSETDVIQPALAVDEQRAAFPRTAAGLGGATVEPIAPPPSVQGIAGGGTQAAGQIIALGLHPVEPAGPIVVPAGNRRGEFAATPQGKPGASGTPELKGGGTGAGGNGKGNGAGNGGAAQGPAGIYVGAGAAPGAGVAGSRSNLPPASAKQVLLAAMAPTRINAVPRQTMPAPAPDVEKGSELERKVFGVRKYYTMMLNMPNLTSAGGSWIIRFAELHFTPGGADLTAPVATQKVDPAYPASLMRAHIEGTVTLYAVIHSDGSVGDVRVLRGVNQRLDENARAALAQWRFQPATKNGEAVALEAVVIIPFSAPKMRF